MKPKFQIGDIIKYTTINNKQLYYIIHDIVETPDMDSHYRYYVCNMFKTNWDQYFTSLSEDRLELVS